MSTTTGPRDRGAHGAPPAPVGRRVVAALVDGALTSLCAAPLVAAVLPAWLAAARATAGTGTAAPSGPAPVLLVAGAVLLLAWGGVQWWCHGTRGWTVGRRALGLRTVDVRSGRPVGLGRALVRSLVVAAGALACGVGQLVVLLSPLVDPGRRRRGWHDRVAEAVVVDVRGLGAVRRLAAPAAAAPRPGPGALVVPVLDAPPVLDALPVLDGPPPAAPAAPAQRTRGSARPSAAPGGVPHQVSPEPGLSPDLDRSPATGPAVAPEPLAEPSPPGRTRWTTLAAGRRLDAPDLVLPALRRPGPGPDLDTRQLPAVGAPGALRVPAPAPDPLPGWAPPPTPVPGPRPPDPLDRAVPWPADQPPAEPPTAGPTPTGPGDATPPRVVPPLPVTSPPVEAPASALPPEAFPAPAPAGTAPGASAWTVRLPDGSVVGLDVPLLVGRDPAPVPGARPVAVADPGRSVSKTHLMLGVDEHGSWVVDRGSTNGTLVTLGDGQRIVCLADRRVRLTDGTLVAFGDLSLSVRVRA